jgi:hypothetical protein
VRNQIPDDDSDPVILPAPVLPGSLAERAVPCSLVQFGSMVRSFDVDDFEGKAKLVMVTSPPTLDLNKDGYVNMNITDYAVYIREGPDRKTGDMVQYLWTVLLDESGDTFATSSPWIAPKVRGILEMFTAADREAGIPIAIVKRASRRGEGDYHDLKLGHVTGKGA